MRRLHVALAVEDLESTIRDYSDRLGAEPVVVIDGRYALWRTAEVNLSVNAGASGPERLRHIGIEDDKFLVKTESVDVNGLKWEWFSAAMQDREIVRIYGDLGST